MGEGLLALRLAGTECVSVCVHSVWLWMCVSVNKQIVRVKYLKTLKNRITSEKVKKWKNWKQLEAVQLLFIGIWMMLLLWYSICIYIWDGMGGGRGFELENG